MPRIDRIVMQGFKSFANRTVVPFPSGFNAICGPNGSGKSNILDAIVFVLGIRSARSIRAGKLEDLVFKGGDARGSSEYASVSLYIDNTDGEIQGEEEEVKVTRKVRSSGSSVYKLNGVTVNRRRIIDVLASAGIYADGHNIILQGDVTNLIEMSSRERRGIIDEVAGIAEFDDKKEKAERELEKVEEKLGEARVILEEKRKTLEKLEKEQELAREYERLERDLRKIRASIVKKRMDFFRGQMEDIEEKIEERKREVGDIEEELQGVDDELNELQKKEREAAEVALKKGDKELYNRISELKTKVEKRITRIESNKREIKRIEEMIGALKPSSKVSQAVLGMNKKGVHGTIGGLLTVEPKYQTAVKIAAGGGINDVVVRDDGVAQECIDALKSRKVGRATFLPLNKLSVRGRSRKSKELIGNEGVIDFAINLIDYDPAYEAAFRKVFRDTVVVKDLKTARKHMGKARMVTLDGELVQRSGAMTGGHIRKRKNSSQRYTKDKEKLEAEIVELEAELNELQTELSELQEKADEEDSKRTDYEKEMGDTLDRIEELRAERDRIFEKRMKAENKVGKLKVKKAKFETELDNLDVERGAFDEFFENEEFYEEGTVESLQREKKKVLKRINEIGPVNQKAVDDYESLKTLYDDLKAKVDKIREEKEEVLKMAESIERKRVQAFMKTFNEISENFSRIFQKLSGGDARLELEEEGDITSGLILKARPEGKKELHLDSMSGGEKSMTALAFLFAVQMHDPAPFYVLDEIDAALDKKNTRKVADMITAYSEDAQFIVITHNDTTMRMADRVYGVSMEGGVSKVVSLELPNN